MGLQKKEFKRIRVTILIYRSRMESCGQDNLVPSSISAETVDPRCNEVTALGTNYLSCMDI